MGLQEVVSKAKRESEYEQDNSLPENELTDSLRLLVERDNPMADAAEKALERL